VAQGLLQIGLFCALLVAVMPLLGNHMARVFTRAGTGRAEGLMYRALRIDPDAEQDWKAYARSVLAFSLVSWLALYLILRTQTLHPLNDRGFHSGTWDVTFNTASSFVTNTNWQFYGGESTLTNVSQAVGLAVQNFVSAAVGIAVAIALIRAIARRRGDAPEGRLGSFWRDLVRATLYVLLPLSVLGAVALGALGVVQTLHPGTGALALGPVASQESIKLLGTNGGGFFNVNSAFPFENPTALSNVLEMVLILCIPVALTWTYGRMVGSRRQGLAIFAAMSVVFVAGVVVVYLAELHNTPAQMAAGLGGENLEGKDVRFGVAGSSLWTAVTTVTSCGAVNAALESLTGIGGLVPFANLGMSETIFGGVGAGLYSMLLYVLLAVFLGGLMVGRTPEYLGKKLGPREVKLVALGTLLTPITVLLSAALAVGTTWGRPSIFASGPQGFSESLYAYSSQANNNGSAFAGYTGYVQPEPGNLGAHGVTFADLLGGGVMLLARFAPILLVLAVAGALAGRRVAPAGVGTMRTDTPTFVVLLVSTVVLVGALTFLPALLLGPVVQGMTGRLF
jgi:K+-transporting ATPase ATPase A chain